jgi:hypothetical protein
MGGGAKEKARQKASRSVFSFFNTQTLSPVCPEPPCEEETGCPVSLEELPGNAVCRLFPPLKEYDLILEEGHKNGLNFACNFI